MEVKNGSPIYKNLNIGYGERLIVKRSLVWKYQIKKSQRSSVQMDVEIDTFESDHQNHSKSIRYGCFR